MSSPVPHLKDVSARSRASLEAGAFGGRSVDAGKDRPDRLVERARRGDVGAFEEMVQPYIAPLYRLAAAMVGPEDARDVTQETLVSAWRELHHLKRADRLEAWLRSIIMNRARNLLRSRRRHPAVRFDPAVGHADGLNYEPMDRLAGTWAIDDALAMLRPDERAVIVLHYLADLPLRQVAATLGVAEGTAKSRLHAALRSLRITFGRDEA